MIGLAVLAVVAAYVAVFGFVIAKARNRTEKISAVAIALLIPFWDLPFGYLNFRHHCAELGGLHVEAKLGAAEAILVDPDLAYTPDQLQGYGFKIIEYGKLGQIARFTASTKGLIKSIHEAPVSSLKVHFIANQRLPWNLVRRDFLVSHIKTGQVVARHTDFLWRGLWWQIQAAPLLGNGGRCHVPKDNAVLAVVARGTT